MTPQNPQFEADVRATFATQGLMASFGAEVVEVTPGRVILAAPITPAVSQHHGFGHGGLTWSLGDTAGGCAAMTLMAASQGVLTVEMKINFLAPAEGARIVAVGEVIRPGRRITVVRSDVFAEEAGVPVIATMLGTMMAVAR